MRYVHERIAEEHRYLAESRRAEAVWSTANDRNWGNVGDEALHSSRPHSSSSTKRDQELKLAARADLRAQLDHLHSQGQGQDALRLGASISSQRPQSAGNIGTQYGTLTAISTELTAAAGGVGMPRKKAGVISYSPSSRPGSPIPLPLQRTRACTTSTNIATSSSAGSILPRRTTTGITR